MQCNTTSRPIIFYRQIYKAQLESLNNQATLDYCPGLTPILLTWYYLNQFFN